MYAIELQPKFVGVVPQWRERGEACYRQLGHPELKLLDITRPPGQFLAELTECRAVLSASLHGLVAAHAYGIPALWIQPTNKPLGDGFKFRDYLKGVEQPQNAGETFASAAELLHLADRARAPQFDLAPFLEAFPAAEFGVSRLLSGGA